MKCSKTYSDVASTWFICAKDVFLVFIVQFTQINCCQSNRYCIWTMKVLFTAISMSNLSARRWKNAVSPSKESRKSTESEQQQKSRWGQHHTNTEGIGEERNKMALIRTIDIEQSRQLIENKWQLNVDTNDACYMCACAIFMEHAVDLNRIRFVACFWMLAERESWVITMWWFKHSWSSETFHSPFAIWLYLKTHSPSPLPSAIVHLLWPFTVCGSTRAKSSHNVTWNLWRYANEGTTWLSNAPTRQHTHTHAI